MTSLPLKGVRTGPRVVEGPLSMALVNRDIFPNRWVIQRYDPNEFVEFTEEFQGRARGLRITTTSAEGSANRPGGEQGTFYDTQGRGLFEWPWGGLGSVAESQLYVPADWADRAGSGSKRSGMSMDISTDASPLSTSNFAFMEFSNDENNNRNDSTPGFYWFGSGTGNWNLVSSPVRYDDWNTVSMALLDRAPGDPFEGDAANPYFLAYYLNGDYAGGFYMANGRNFRSSYFYIYNFYQPAFSTAVPVDYSAHWAIPPGKEGSQIFQY